MRGGCRLGRVPGFVAVIGAVMLSAAAAARSEAPYQAVWGRQIGTAKSDFGYSVTVDGQGNVFISGFTDGNLVGTSAGNNDAFLAKYDNSGHLLWNQQFGTAQDDYSYAVSVDAQGNAYLSGYTRGGLVGNNAGAYDAFLRKYDASGNPLWTRQFGTTTWDYAVSTAVDAQGNAYVGGHTAGGLGGATNAGDYDVFLAKYNTSGDLVWTRQFGTSEEDKCGAVAVDGQGHVYVSGYMWTGNNGYDPYLTKFDASSGTRSWTKQLAYGSWDMSYGVATDAQGNVYMANYVEGGIFGGTYQGAGDCLLVKYDSSGNRLWSREFGTYDRDYCFAVAVDGQGNAYLVGDTYGTLAGSNAGYQDGFMTKYDTSGNLLWTRQIGTATHDYFFSVVVDGQANAYVAGITDGSLIGPNAGGYDAMLMKLSSPSFPSPIPEPGTLGLLTMGGWVLLRRRRH